MITKEEIKKLAPAWSEPQEKQTKNGPMLLSQALGWKPDKEFWDLWNANKFEIKKLGFSLGKSWPDEKDWELKLWEDLPEEVKTERAQSVEMSKATDAVIEVPAPAGLAYMPFQKGGIQFGLSRKNVLIADEMGLGKTIQTIGIINGDETVKRVLVICPKSLKINWMRELKRWLVRPMTIGAVNGGWVETDIVVVNYDALNKFFTQTHAIEWDMVVLDEAHLIKNAKTQRSANIKGRPESRKRKRGQLIVEEALPPIKGRRWVLLTGTPIVNRPVELYNLIHNMHPVWNVSFYQFAKRYAAAHRTRHGTDFSGASNLDELQKRLRETIMVRRLKSEVLTELPRKIRQVVEVEPETKAQRDAIEAEKKYEIDRERLIEDLKTLTELSKADSEEAYKAAVTRLMEATQVSFTEMAKYRYETAMAKLPAVIEHVRNSLEDGDNKIIVAAHHHDVVDGLVEGLKEFNPVSLTGRESEVQRIAAVDAFQNDPKVRVFIGGIKAAGVGITLTASSHVVFAELDWVPGNMSQMEDRAHRIGQTETVLVQHVVLSGSIDAKMVQTLIDKQKVIEDALDKDHPERQKPVYEPKVMPPATTYSATAKQIEEEAVKLTDEQVTAIHNALRILAGMDYDGAMERNDVGFNKLDTNIGRSLASNVTLTPKQAALGKKIVLKYHRQIGQDLVAIIKGKEQAKA